MKKVISSIIAILLLFTFPLSAFAAIAVDASSPARATLSGDCTLTGVSTITTSTFDPPANSVIVVTIQADSDTSVGHTFPSQVANNGAALTWTQIAQEDFTAGGGSGNGGIASAFYTTLLGARTGMTITASLGGNGLTQKCSISTKVYVLTGANTVSPLGHSTQGSSVTNNLTTTSFTSTVDNSLGFVAANEWSGLGTPSSSDTTNDPFTITTPAADSGISGYKTISTANSTVTFNLDAFGTANAAWNWVSFEIKPNTSAAASTFNLVKFISSRVKFIFSRVKITH
jgi:hypothetical protein